MLCWFVWTDNHVGDDGMEVLCEALKENTTLTKVNMECLLWMVLLRMSQMDETDEWQWTGNGIGDGGAVALSHVLKSEESVLASISLYGVLPFLSNLFICGCVCMSHAFVMCVDMATGNKIGVRGVSALCDALKDNTTLTALDIGGEVPWCVFE